VSRVVAFPEQIEQFQKGLHHLRRPDLREIRLSDPAGGDGDSLPNTSSLPVVVAR
jgi:hypothetical protein